MSRSSAQPSATILQRSYRFLKAVATEAQPLSSAPMSTAFLSDRVPCVSPRSLADETLCYRWNSTSFGLRNQNRIEESPTFKHYFEFCMRRKVTVEPRIRIRSIARPKSYAARVPRSRYAMIRSHGIRLPRSLCKLMFSLFWEL